MRWAPGTPREAERTQYAFDALVRAEEAGGGDALGEARGLLQTPCAQSAAIALLAIGHAATICGDEARGPLLEAERAVRDVVVLRCCAGRRPRDVDHGAFLEAAEAVFGRPLHGAVGDADRLLRAKLLLAHHKLRS